MFRHLEPPFADKINGKGVIPQNKKVKPIFEFFLKKLKEEKKPEDLQNIIETLESISFIKITIKKEEHAYELFERTNARGSGLEVSDLLKNHMFKNVDTVHDDKSVAEQWSDIEKNSDKGIVTLLRYYYISRKNHITRPKLYAALKNMLQMTIKIS